MRLGGRLAAAIDVLGDMEARKRPIAEALKDWGLSHRFAGSLDRAAIGNIVYDALRKRLSHAFLMDSDSPAMLAHAVLFRDWKIAPDRLAAETRDDRFAPPPPGPETLAAFQSRDLADAPAHVRADVPEWTAASFEAAFGDDWVHQLQALTERPPLDLRVNTLRATRDKVLKALGRSGAGPTALARQGVRIPAGAGPARLPNVTAEPAFAKGWFEVQDEGSQIVSDLVMAGAGEQVLDFCAGGGGKALAMSAAMGNKGQVHAFDADRKRLAPIFERLKRAGTRNVQVHDDRQALGALAERCDRVLVDAPCTGTGTWRRRPDAKWRLSPENLVARMAEQDAVLAEAAHFVRRGGRLDYVTCSLLPEENGQRIEQFLTTRPEFELGPAGGDWEKLFGGAARSPVRTDGGTVLLTPASTGTDGFFFASLVRRD